MSRSPSPRLVVAPYPALASRLASDLMPRLTELQELRESTEPPVIIVPGGGVARGLQLELLARFPSGYVSPKFLTIERLAETLLAASEKWRPPAGSTIRSLAMSAASRAARGTLEPTSLASVADRSWRDAADAGIDPFSLASRAERNQRPFIRLAETVWRRYLAVLEEARRADPASILRELLHALENGATPPEIVAVYGFYDATGMQTRALRALLQHADVPAVYVPAGMTGDELIHDYRFAERLVHDLGLSLSGAESIETRPSVVELVTTLSPARQAAEISDRIATDIASGVDPQRIAVLARSISPPDLEMWRLEAERRGFTFERRPARAFTSTRVGRVIEILLRIQERDFQRSDVLELIDIGLRKLSDARRSLVAITDSTRALSIASGTAEALRARFRDTDSDHLRAYIETVAILESITALPTQERTARQWTRMLELWREEVSIRTEEDLRALEKFDEWLDDIRQIGEVALSADEVTRSLHSLEIPVPSSPGVFIGDFMQARGRIFDAIYLVDATEGSLPQGRIQDPLLDDDLRQRAGMRSIGNGDLEERMLFRAVLDSSRTATITWPEFDASGKANRPSPYVTQLAASMHPGHTAAVFGDLAQWLRERKSAPAESRDADVRVAASLARGDTREVEPALADILTAHASIGAQGRWDGFVSGDAELREQLLMRLGVISPTALEHYGACPHQFLVRSVLRIPEGTEPEDLLELQAKDKGNVLHSILEHFYRGIDRKTVASWDPEQQELPPMLEALLEDCVQTAFDAMNQEAPPRFPVMRELERADALRTLRRFLIRDLAELATSGYLPAHFEFRFGDRQGLTGDAPAAAFELGELTVQVRGTIDRVDVATDGRVRIVDYKSSGSRYKDLRSRVLNGTVLQLAMYCRAWMGLNGTPASMMSAAILPLRETSGVSLASLSFDYGEIADRLDRILELFTSGIAAGQFPAIPGSHCEYCPVAAGCRVRYEPDERLSLLGHTAGTLLWPEEDWS